MKTIRNNVFETNSSSCHVLTLLTQQEYDALLQHKAILRIVPGSDYGPEGDMLSEVLNYDQFVTIFFDEIFKDETLKNHRKVNEQYIKVILKEFWKNIVEDTENGTIKNETDTGNAYFFYKYETLEEWNKIDSKNLRERLARRLKFYIPTYNYDYLLLDIASKQINHNTIYAVSWEKEY